MTTDTALIRVDRNVQEGLTLSIIPGPKGLWYVDMWSWSPGMPLLLESGRKLVIEFQDNYFLIKAPPSSVL